MPMTNRLATANQEKPFPLPPRASVRAKQGSIRRAASRSRALAVRQKDSPALKAAQRPRSLRRLTAPVHALPGIQGWDELQLSNRAMRCRLAARLAAKCFEVPLEEVAAPGRYSARSARARQVAMYLAHVAFGLPLTTVGKGFGRDRTTVAHACRQVEDKRDDPAFDAMLAGLELVTSIMLGNERKEVRA